jgi:hypothetical protein
LRAFSSNRSNSSQPLIARLDCASSPELKPISATGRRGCKVSGMGDPPISPNTCSHLHARQGRRMRYVRKRTLIFALCGGRPQFPCTPERLPNPNTLSLGPRRWFGNSNDKMGNFLPPKTTTRGLTLKRIQNEASLVENLFTWPSAVNLSFSSRSVAALGASGGSSSGLVCTRPAWRLDQSLAI